MHAFLVCRTSALCACCSKYEHHRRPKPSSHCTSMHHRHLLQPFPPLLLPAPAALAEVAVAAVQVLHSWQAMIGSFWAVVMGGCMCMSLMTWVSNAVCFKCYLLPCFARLASALCCSLCACYNLGDVRVKLGNVCINLGSRPWLLDTTCPLALDSSSAKRRADLH